MYNAIEPNMRKEILLAIIVGILAGLGVTFGIYTLRQTLLRGSTPDKIEESRQKDQFATPAPSSSSLTIKSPTPDFLTNQKELQIVGKALPESYIVILAPTGEYITTADQDGDFATTIPLALGGNKITVTATTPEGQQESLVITAAYSTIDFNSPNATRSGSQP